MNRQHSYVRTAIVIDKEPAIHKAISRLGHQENFLVTGFHSGADFVGWYGDQFAHQATTRSHCLVVGVDQLPDIAEKFLVHAKPDIPKIFIGEPRFSCELTKLSTVGCFACLEKPFSIDQIRQKLHAAFLHYEKSLHGVVKITEQFYRLSKREYEVGKLVASGLMNQEIAEKLGISIKTVKVHRGNVMKKTESHTVVDLLRCFDSYGNLKTT